MRLIGSQPSSLNGCLEKEDIITLREAMILTTPRVILFTNVYNFYNQGEVLQLEALTKHLRTSAFSILSIYSFVDQGCCENLGLKVVGTNTPRRSIHLGTWALYTALRALLWRITHVNRFLSEELAEILRSDVVVDLGGDTFRDDYGIGYAIAHSYSLLLAGILGKPYLVCSQTIGPFENPILKHIARYVLHGALAVTAREPLTYNYLANELGLENVYLAPDVAFLSSTTATPPAKSMTDGFTIGLNVSPLISNWMFPNVEGLREKQKHFATLMSDVVAYISEKYGSHSLLIPHVTGPVASAGKKLRDDRVVARMVFETVKGDTNVILLDDASMIKDAISSCDIFIGSRMHSVISAVNVGVPAIPLAYSQKTLGLAEMLGFSDYVVDVRNKGHAELKSEIISTFEGVRSDYERAVQVFRRASQKAMRDAKVHLRAIETSKILSLFRMKQCRGCGTCAGGCPHDAIRMVLTPVGSYRPKMDFERCIGCGVCMKVCPEA